MRYRIRHTTRYTYDDEVTDSFGLAYLRPRDLPWQRCLTHEVTLTPGPSDQSTRDDFYGNRCLYFQVSQTHRELAVTGVSDVECIDRGALDGSSTETAGLSWELARPAARSDHRDAWKALDFACPSALVDIDDTVTAYAERSFTPARPIGEAVIDLMHRIHDDFEYEAGSTDLSTRVTEVLAARAGVCQDFAHLTVACLRSVGLAGRYVSGYLATSAPPGHPRLVGADASHAWAACWIPDHGWLAIDPTNDLVAQERHVTVAWGRDYSDVPPVKGVIFSEAIESTMSVMVDVDRLD